MCADRGVPLAGPSGASAHLRGVVGALRDEGHAVSVAAHSGPSRWPAGLRTWGARRDRAALLRGARADVIWERHAWPYGSAEGHLLEVNAPLARERGMAREQDAERRAITSAREVIAVSRWLAAWAVELGCDPARVRHVPNGTAAIRGDRDAARARLGLHGPVVGFVGSMRPWHGADRLPALLDALGPEWTGLAVGDGPAPPSDHPRLVRTGHVTEAEAADLVAAMDVAVAPYRTDAPPWFCPLKILAYRAQGVPVVGPDLGDVPLLVGDAGHVMTSDDADAWAHSIKTALELPRARWLRSWRHVIREVLGNKANS